uniref:Uncharacterized protein n=1 Tax=Lotharella globosa TaxID=91324 RepID=A0A7S3Z7Z3_9EUKA|mmetsp:Transcript_3615/g.7331  ORF Transcript_3615/g.7331 Transcript_3615/m.7331 type:complete len:241 (+) Transcript_3615:2-724(+)
MKPRMRRDSRSPPRKRQAMPARNTSKSSNSSAVPEWLKAAMLQKKKEKAELEKLQEQKQLKKKVEKQRESAGVAEKEKEDEEDIPGITFENPVADPTFDYALWAAHLDPACRETMDALLKHLDVKEISLRELGRKETVGKLKVVCKQKSVRTSLRKSILELYSRINRKKIWMQKKAEAEAREAEFRHLKRKQELAEEDSNSRTAQRKRQRDILEAFAKNRGGKGQMVKHKPPKKMPKLFG